MRRADERFRTPVIDSHQHFWDPAAATYEWMPEPGTPLHRRFGTEDLEPILKTTGVDQTIVVQARSSLDETQFLLDTARRTQWIAGVVGWVDLSDQGLADILQSFSCGPRALVGVRHQVESEPDPEWLRRSDVRRGVAIAGAARLSVDLLVRPENLPSAVALVRELPEVRFVLDHIGKPRVEMDVDPDWRAGIAELAAAPNVWCKLSGLQSHFGPQWNSVTLAPWAWRAFNSFGPDRILFGSDWPVCTPSASYFDVIDWARVFIRSIGVNSREFDAVFGGNAIDAYRLVTPGGSSSTADERSR